MVDSGVWFLPCLLVSLSVCLYKNFDIDQFDDKIETSNLASMFH